MNLKPHKIGLVRSARLNLCLVLVLTVLLLGGAAIWSQQNPGISVDVKVVNIFAAVRNKHGEIVKDLNKDDFVLDEDGRPQTIAYFTQETNLPLTLGLLVDTSMSQRRVLGDERSASFTFLDHVLREDRDKAFVIHFDKEVELLQDLTSSKKKLESALNLLESPEQDGGYSSGGGRGQRGSRGGAGTLLYDAVYLASNEMMSKQQGRKALIILSDGVDHGSKESLDSAIVSAQRADTLVYSILFSGEEGNGGGFGGFGRGGMGGPGGGMGGGGHRRYPQPQEDRPDGKKILDRISKETGGHLFQVSKKESIDQIYSSIEDELRNQYSLGYTPVKTDSTASYHKIHLTTKNKDLTVQARDGYYSDR
ncbi:MAG: VWA domain-containing protein [Candidatus Acidiferrales bacterium]|jgi:VWFA-related protein